MTRDQGGPTMVDEKRLEELLREAAGRGQTPVEIQRQRISLACGLLPEGSTATREDVAARDYAIHGDLEAMQAETAARRGSRSEEDQSSHCSLQRSSASRGEARGGVGEQIPSGAAEAHRVRADGPLAYARQSGARRVLRCSCAASVDAGAVTGTFRRETRVLRGRKSHRCSYCSGTIPAGDPSVVVAQRWDGSFFADRGHVDCVELWNEAYADHSDVYEGMPIDLAEALGGDEGREVLQSEYDAYRGLYPHVVCRLELRLQMEDSRYRDRCSSLGIVPDPEDCPEIYG